MTEKMSTTTPDIERENAEKLAELFPSVVIEVAGEDGIVHAAIDADALRELVGDVAEGQRERYQFTWPGKRQAKAEAYTPIDQTMRPEPGRSVGWDTTDNLYIKGDNLDALKLLRSTYAGKVKLIYIDPSYNTGHDLLYDDDFARTRADYDEEGGRLVENTTSNGRLHSDWRSMIYPRLLLLRDLLSSDGAIFSSIDDNESANLRKICDEVFGAGCFVASLPRVTKRSGKDHGTTVAKNHDYVYVYAKNINFLHLKGIGVDDGSYPLVDDYVNERSRDCGGNLGPRRDWEEDHMHGQERRRLATGTLTELDHSYAGAIVELGYPTRSAPRTWRDDSGGAAPAPARGAPVRREHRPRVRGPRPPAPPRPVARGDEEAVRPGPAPARRRVGGTPASPWRRAGAPARGSPRFPRPRPGRRARGRTRPPSIPPAATWHGTGGAGASRGAAWPVPAVAERWRGHLARRQARLRPAAGGHVAHPHLSHSQPSGHLNPVSRPSRPHRPGTWPAGRGGRPSPPDLPAPRVAHRAPLPRSPFPGTMARHGRRCVTCDYEATLGSIPINP